MDMGRQFRRTSVRISVGELSEDEKVFKVTERVGTHRISLARGGKKVVSCDYSEVRCLFNCTYKTI